MPHLTRLVSGPCNFIDGDSKMLFTRRSMSCGLLLACVLQTNLSHTVSSSGNGECIIGRTREILTSVFCAP